LISPSLDHKYDIKFVSILLHLNLFQKLSFEATPISTNLTFSFC
jgi:hypothetical protein